MLDAAQEALSFIKGRCIEDLSRDRMFFLALLKEIEIIGEAATKISVETREALPAVPWPAIKGLRNRLIHVYAEVDTRVIWSTLTISLPNLVRELEEALAG